MYRDRALCINFVNNQLTTKMANGFGMKSCITLTLTHKLHDRLSQAQEKEKKMLCEGCLSESMVRNVRTNRTDKTTNTNQNNKKRRQKKNPPCN